MQCADARSWIHGEAEGVFKDKTNVFLPGKELAQVIE
jgi:hypothetical protein